MDPQIIHVVLIRWARTTPPDVVARFDAATRAVRETVPGVLEVTHGPSVSVEHLEQGYDYGLQVRFADAAARDAYLPHPAHRPLADLITTHAETFVVFDLPAGEGTGAGSTTAPRPRAVLAHGAASGPWVFDAWQPRWTGFEVVTPDLQDGGELGATRMGDYADRIQRAAWPSADSPDIGPVVLVGWSMGGLAAMMTALRRTPAALVVIEPSVPAEVGGDHPTAALEHGTYGADVYGAVAAPNQSRRESLLARSERKRGISIPALPCPTLVVAGRDYRDERGRGVADRYGTDLLEYPRLGHSDLVTSPAVADTAVAWVRTVLSRPREGTVGT